LKTGTLLLVLGLLAVIALAATVIALSFQRYYGRLPMLVFLGQVLAAIGAAAFALWLKRKR
jgi:hypothetical protein